MKYATKLHAAQAAVQKYNNDTLCVCDLIFKLNIPPKLKSPFGRDGCGVKKEVPLFSKGCNYTIKLDVNQARDLLTPI